MQASTSLAETGETQALSAASLQAALVHPTPGAFMLANMPQAEFDQHLQTLKLARDRVQIIQRELMEVGVHYGRVPGVEKPFLHQPGAEVLAQMLHLVPEYVGTVEWGDGVDRPAVTLITECRLHYGTLDGPVVGTGRGACTSWERKYRYRKADRTCPECARVGSVRKSKEEYGGGWYCAANSGGCGAKFKKGDVRIEKQELGMVENPDQADLLQTVLAMGDKRSYVKAVRTTTATSDLFTQDDDLVAGEDSSVETAAGVGKNAAPAGDQKKQEPPKGAQPPAGQQQQPPPAKKRVYSYDETWTMTADAARGLQADVDHPRLTEEQIAQIQLKASQMGWGADMTRVTVQQRLGPLGYPTLADVPAGPENILFRRLLYIFGNYRADDHFTPPSAGDEDPFGEAGAGAAPPEPAGSSVAAEVNALQEAETHQIAALFPAVAPLQAANVTEALDKIKRLLPARKGKPFTAAQTREILALAADSGWGPQDLDELLVRHLGMALSGVPWTVEREIRWLVCTFPGPNAPEGEEDGFEHEPVEQDIPA